MEIQKFFIQKNLEMAIAFIVGCVVFVFLLHILKKKWELRKYPYEPKELLSPAEKYFYNQLYPLCQKKKMRICPKVRLEDFICVKSETKDAFKFRSRIKSRHVDFLICNKEMETVLAIELDDSSHYSERAKEADAFKNKLYDVAGIPLLRVQVKRNYEEDIHRIDELFL